MHGNFHYCARRVANHAHYRTLFRQFVMADTSLRAHRESLKHHRCHSCLAQFSILSPACKHEQQMLHNALIPISSDEHCAGPVCHSRKVPLQQALISIKKDQCKRYLIRCHGLAPCSLMGLCRSDEGQHFDSCVTDSGSDSVRPSWSYPKKTGDKSDALLRHLVYVSRTCQNQVPVSAHDPTGEARQLRTLN